MDHTPLVVPWWQRWLGGLFRWLYRVEVRGAHHLAECAGGAVVAVNHVSFLDGPLLVALLPGEPMVAINTQIAQAWWVRPVLPMFRHVTLDPTNPMAVKALIRLVREGEKLLIFPEGRITVTGTLMKIYEGPGLIADKARAPLIAVRIEGAQYTPFSRLRGLLPTRWRPRIVITVDPPRPFVLPEGLSGRQRRQRAGLLLYDILSAMAFANGQLQRTLFRALLEARAIHGGQAVVLEDLRRAPMSYDRLVVGALALGRVLAGLTQPGERVGLLLPNALGTVVAFFALQSLGRVPAMLNHTSGVGNCLAACRAAGVRLVITSSRFIQLARLEKLRDGIAQGLDGRVVELEALAAGIGRWDKLRALAVSRLPCCWLLRQQPEPEAPAVVLFTSGSEGTPKGVVLSHRNLAANGLQLSIRLDFNPTDTVFNALPLFHSFGLTAGLLLPLMYGVRTFLYPSPLHYRVVPELVYDTNATIFFGADTFLAGYAKMAHPYDFYSVRYVFAGAERLRESTRQAWVEKFGKRILEGYGATETAPALAINTAMHYREGTVGRLLPGIQYRLEPVAGIEQGGKLLVKGANVMLGYLRAERPGVLEPPEGGWYDTGDIVEIDDEGYVKIKGRVKRFAKVGGEMVSLGAVEELAAQAWPKAMSAVVALPDHSKGERLVLVTTRAGATRAELLEEARRRGMPELGVPRQVLSTPQIPLLGSGKTDYPRLTEWVKEQER